MRTIDLETCKTSPPPLSSQQSFVGHRLMKSNEPWGGNTHEMALAVELN